MFHNLGKLSFALTAVAILCLASPGVAQTTVPHKESADGTLTKVIPPNPPVVSLGTLEFTAQGVATDMGRYTQVGGHNFTALNFTALNPLGVGQVRNGVFKSTAADGSTISGTYSGTYNALGNNMFQFDVTAKWLTGTGRLAGVTGQAQVVAILNGTTGIVHYDDLGTWTLP